MGKKDSPLAERIREILQSLGKLLNPDKPLPAPVPVRPNPRGGKPRP